MTDNIGKRFTFYMSNKGRYALEELTVRISEETGIQFSMSKVLELTVLHCKNIAIKNLIKDAKST